MPDPDAPTFDVGLVMAGAVSAGAYTAGVIDFLFQALDAWEVAKQRADAFVPPHRVNIKVLSGASAGGMTAAMVATLVRRTLDPVAGDERGPVRNKLYRSWVHRIDARPLLGLRDLDEGDGPVRSLLDSSVLDDIADDVFRDDGAPVRRAYVDDALHLYLSVSNLRGVPYNIAFAGSEEVMHQLSLHADHLHFVVGEPPERPGEAIALDPSNLDDPRWQLLRQAALASGAFPIGLAPRPLTRQAGDYARRRWPIPNAEGERWCRLFQPIPPYWDLEDDAPYDFLCVDGGLMNNEPLELARRTLAGADRSNPRAAERATRAVLMIDPFPNVAPFTLEYDVQDDRIGTVISHIFASLKHQARFKLDELVLAQAEHVYSRFLVAPARTEAGRRDPFPLACGGLAGFGGFLSEKFRRHDFHLGRRNCQWFLRRYFAIPDSPPGGPENPLFERWTPAMKDAFGFVDASSGRRYLPIIPLVDGMEEPVPLPEKLPVTRRELDVLMRLIETRVDRVVRRLLDDYEILQGFALRRVLFPLVWRKKRRRVVEAIREVIEEDLRRRGLLA